ncbi:MAG: hypothetical protein DYG96_08425 [Chlorobi bacterium CHB2]|nr:hypothetical protein [Chlorobi bacterium CHB2]
MLEIAGGIGPSTNNSFSLGSSTRRWEDLFLGPNSLHIGINGSEGIIGYDPITKSFLFDPDGDGMYEAIMDANGYIAVGTTSTLNPLTIEGDADQLVLQRKTTSPTRVSQKFNLLGDYWQVGTDNTNSPGQFFFDANGTRRVVFNKNGNVGLGTVTPANVLDVEGGAAIGATYSGTTAAPANGLIVEGNVGVGTNDPSDFKLEVNGSVGPNSDNTFDLGSQTRRWRDVFVGPNSLHLGVPGNEAMIGYDIANNLLTFNPSGDGSAEAVMSDEGSTGLGTTTPQSKLDVEGGAAIGATYSGTTAAPANGLIVEGNVGVGTTSTSDFKLQVGGHVGPNDDYAYDLGSTTKRWRGLYLDSIGLSMGTGTNQGFISYSTSTNSFRFNPSGDGTPEAVMDINGNFSVGTTTTDNPATIVGDPDQLVLQPKAAAPNSQRIARLKLDGQTNDFQIGMPDTTGTLIFNGNGGVEKMALDQSGNLSVAGNITPSGTSKTLGTTTTRWEDLFVGPTSVHIGNAASDETVLSYANSSSTKRMQVDADGDGDNEATITGAGRMGVGTDLPQSALDVEGGAAIGATYSGTTAAPANGLLVEGNVGVGTTSTSDFKLQVEGTVGPNTDNTYSLGSASKRWTKVFTSSGLDINGPLTVAGSAGTAGQYLASQGASTAPAWKNLADTVWSLAGNSITDDTTRYLGTNNAQDLAFATEGIIRARFLRSTGAPLDYEGSFVPEVDSAVSLGSPERRWRSLYVTGGSIHIGRFSAGGIANLKGGPSTQSSADGATISYDNTNDVLVIDKPINSGGTTQPDLNNVFSLGSTTNRWKDLYLGPSTLFIGTSTTDEAKVSYNTAANELRIDMDNTGGPEFTLTQAGGINIAGKATSAATVGADAATTLTTKGYVDGTVSAITLSGDVTGATGTTTIATTAGANIVAAINASSSTINDARLAASLSRDTESPAAGDVSGSLSAGYSVNSVQSGAGTSIITAINAAAGTINAARIGNGLTNTQVNDDLSITAGTIENSPIGATTASTGRFTTITGTALPASSTSTNIVTSNSGALETRTIASLTGVIGVSADSSIVGDGTTGSPLGVDLSETNTWTGEQTFPTTAAQGDALIASVNAGTGTINAARIGNGLTNTQVNDDLSITAGTIENSPIGATTASTGRFTTITGTALPASSTSTNIVTSNSGALETRTIASLTGVIGVSANSSIVGDGTTGSPLGVDLSETNTWTGEQTFPTTAAQGDALIASVNSGTSTINDPQLAASLSRDTESPAAGDVSGSLSAGYSVNSVQSGAGTSIITAINASAGTVDAARIGNGLTDAQVGNTLTLTGGAIDGVAIGATTASSGKFTTLTATSETVLSHDNSLVGDANGTIPNGTSVAVIKNGTANSDPTAITITLPSAVVGQVLWIYNADANATATLSPAPMAGSTTIPAGTRLMLIYVNSGTAGWVAW